MESKKAKIITTCAIFYIFSPADETGCCFSHFLPPSLISTTDLNARSRETERSDRARSDRDVINERRFRSIGLIRLNKRTAV